MSATPDIQRVPTLAHGEHIIWQDGPKPGIWFEGADLFAVPFSIVWCFIACMPLIMMASGQFNEVDPIAYVVMPLFAAFGLYFVFGRFLLARKVRSRTRYFLTNQRAIIAEGLFRRHERTVHLAAVAEIRLSNSSDGYGTIEFGAGSPFYRIMPRSFAFGQFSAMAPAFERIANAEEVYQKALQLQKTSSR